MSKFKRNLYCKEKFIYEDGMHKLIESSDGTLFSGQRRTKIYEYELPEWYLRGTFYRREGYLSVKGITDLLYVPNMHINHFLRDDYLLIAYGGKITPNNDFETYPYEKYLGYDERVWGGEILDVLKGARKYSDMDIAPIIEQIKKKQQCFKENHPRDYQSECGNFDADACFREDFDNRHHPKYYSIALDDYFTLAFSSFAKQYYGTLKDIEEITELLDPERYKGLLAAFRQFKAGNTKVTHTIASGETKQLLTPVNLIKQTFVCLDEPKQWDFPNMWGFTYTMRYNYVCTKMCILEDGGKYIRCIKPYIDKLEYRDELASEDWYPITHFWGHPGVLTAKEDWQKRQKVCATLYLKDKEYTDVKEAVHEFEKDPLELNILCQDIFADG